MYQSQLCQIIQARMEQIFAMVKSAIVKNSSEKIKQLSGNIILTGGGAQMDGVVELAQNVFKTSSVRLGLPENLGGIEEKYRRPDFATAVGLVLSSKTLLKGRESKRKAKPFGSKAEKSRSNENPVKKFLKMFF